MPVSFLTHFAALAFTCVVVTALPALWAGAYLLLTAICFVAYGWDKGQAKAGLLRVPELVLLLLAVATPSGALAGRTAFNHKTTKAAFLIVPCVAAAFQLVALGASTTI